jgi:hypothetical protein
MSIKDTKVSGCKNLLINFVGRAIVANNTGFVSIRYKEPDSSISELVLYAGFLGFTSLTFADIKTLPVTLPNNSSGSGTIIFEIVNTTFELQEIFVEENKHGLINSNNTWIGTNTWSNTATFEEAVSIENNLITQGVTTSRNFQGSGVATVAFGADATTALGSAGAVSILGNDAAGTVTMTTSGTITAIGNVANVTFSAAYTGGAKGICLTNSGSDLPVGASWSVSNEGTGGFTIRITGVNLITSQSYQVKYIIIH